MSAPTLSVVMPNFNDAEFISVSLQAICEQSVPPTEVIVVDDASTDNSLDVIRCMVSRYGCIRVSQNEVNLGCNFTNKKAARMATGDYIYFASADDMVYPGFFEKAISMLEQYPQSGLCAVDWVIKKDGKVIEENRWLNTPHPRYLTVQELVAEPWNCPFPASASTIYRKRFISEKNAYLSALGIYADWFLVQSIAFRHGCCYVPEQLMAARWMEDGLCNSALANDVLYRQICAKLFQHFTASECSDILPLVLRNRSLPRVLKLSARTPVAVFRALHGINNQSARTLRWSLSIDFVFVEMRLQLILQLKRMVQPGMQVIVDTVKHFGYRLKNLFDRAFAKSFQRYDKARSHVRNQLANFVTRDK